MPRSVAEERSRHGHPIVHDATYKCACSACGQEIRAVLDTFVEGRSPRYVVPVDGDGRCRDCQEYGVDRSRCPLCHGQPVADADAWLDGRPRLPGPCPRCGWIGVGVERDA